MLIITFFTCLPDAIHFTIQTIVCHFFFFFFSLYLEICLLDFNPPRACSSRYQGLLIVLFKAVQSSEPSLYNFVWQIISCSCVDLSTFQWECVGNEIIDLRWKWWWKLRMTHDSLSVYRMLSKNRLLCNSPSSILQTALWRCQPSSMQYNLFWMHKLGMKSYILTGCHLNSIIC